ncbi:acetyl-CoA carboxylase biotin carboxylase subunit [Pullulanibacillus pueri]|uniref:biotin carboxylase n=1 Tax=Pullulanibacillus pueri TaxID=1437324 RepID=A0A8J2ZUH8_9BACL|nr:acetyl-CoA carboxylase biotin carboxylase subunit [Pullulanibacillus pueri]MBM7681294.1 acetyl-CoA carboxylase biotin carboxylase subunit [Pullulanibacillus pueri]GGH77707.1 biotin carboxylase 2 [Pullulanibacillus pueri]
MFFRKILIANRGEIASRIIRTCKRLNIPTVAIYSEPDAQAPFVKLADESFPLGGSQVNESYLNMNKIIAIAKKADVDAIHPGYGLLSENADFAKRCEMEGITFIGPSSTCIEKMGNKIAARQAMKAAGVPIIPGTDEPITSIEVAKEHAEHLGYPVMVKASAGGGGIGMQMVSNEEELEKAIDSNATRAKNFFGDGTLYLEKVIKNAHHIEIQLLADQMGNTLHLYDRECSIQRRHQKVIEEAPSPLLSEETRLYMGETAIKAAKAIQYSSAGTIEFLVDEEQHFYFLEMNTRLQVEHPVTEEITGLDIVEKQIEIASGKSLTLKQSDIKITGHSLEARIYAEDPKTFYPSPGKITTMKCPEGKQIRHELGVQEGFTVSPFYDPMIAKLIVTGHDRMEALYLLNEAVDAYIIKGIKTNLPFIQQILKTDAFKNGRTRTSFIHDYI